MSKINIKVSLTENGTKIYDNEKFIGIKKNNCIVYKEKDVMVTINIFEDKINMIRKNDKYLLDLSFILNQKTQNIYKIKGIGDIIVNIFTNNLICGNTICIEYYLEEQDKSYKFDLFYEVIK